MTARTYIRAPVRVTVSKKSAAKTALPCARRNKGGKLTADGYRVLNAAVDQVAASQV
jgi:hypothetical protein